MNSCTLNLLVDILFNISFLSLFLISFISIVKKIRAANNMKMKLAFIFIGIVNTCALIAFIWIRLSIHLIYS